MRKGENTGSHPFCGSDITRELMMTLTFIYVRSTQCACVRNIDVMITNQRYGPDVSKYTSSVITLTASLCNRKNGSWRDLTLFRTDPLCNPRRQSDRPWEGIGYRDISYKGARDLLLLINQTLSPKPLIKSVETSFPSSVSLGDLTTSALINYYTL